ncbi:glycosyltransferase [Acholeplasma laidlawii]|uniref:glycosyltransferase n=1 Tax=Acholeplasma laidlawii TaxID=2148 RepID=UPI0021F731D7|nr:glycosyltransferase [Acholeplasma laidlawii]
MKILWITNILIGDYVKQKNNKPMGGLWMDALLEKLSLNKELSFIIATTGNVDQVIKAVINDIVYYELPGGLPTNYKRSLKKSREEWKLIIENEKPDLIQVWGTEYSHSLVAVEIAKKMNIKVIVYIQGLMNAISKYTTANLSLSTRFRYTTMRDVFRMQAPILEKKWFKKRIGVENTLLKLADGVIVESDWAEGFCLNINSNLNIIRIPLSINKVFYDYGWDYTNVEHQTIITNASGPAYKGLHILLKALIIVKKKYPNVKVYVPGKSIYTTRNRFIRQIKPGYWNYITDFINRNNLNENIHFLGYLTQEEIAKKLSIANLFVLTSAIENHSSSLKEALIVGTPAIASSVGGVNEYFKYNKNGYIYRFEEYEVLAHYISKIFENHNLSMYFSKNSKIELVDAEENKDLKLFLSMYKNLIKGDPNV